MAQQLARTVCAVLALMCSGCGGAGWEAPTAPGSVGPAGGTVSFGGGLVVLDFPPNAVTEYVTITIRDTTGPTGATVVSGTVFDIGPSLTFSVPVRVTIQYGSATLPAGVLQTELGLYRVVNDAWEKVATSTVDTANKTITAFIGGFSTYGILGAPVAAVTVTPATVSVLAGGTTTLSAAAEDAGGTALPNRTITWSTSFAFVATVSSGGVVTGVSAGAATITAAVVTENQSGTATVTVSVVPVALVTVSPAAAALVVGDTDTVRLTATTRDAANNVLTGRTVTWVSSNANVATVDGNGLVTGRSAGTDTITATSELISGRAVITVTTAPWIPYPNQPPGLTRFAELNFSGIPSLAGQAGTIDGNFVTSQSPATHIVVVQDANAPHSPSSVLQVDFEVGTQPGFTVATGYRSFTGWDLASELSNTEYSEFYESTWFKILSANFETQQVGVKVLGYWGVADNNQDPASGPGPVQLYAVMRNLHEGGPGTSIETRWPLDMYTQGVTSQYWPQNLNASKMIVAGQWHHFETYMKLNDIGSDNGIWRWWLDGVLIGEYTNVRFITGTRSSGFFGRKFQLVWGGQGGTARTRTDYVWFDHLYFSGVFLRNKVP